MEQQEYKVAIKGPRLNVEVAVSEQRARELLTSLVGIPGTGAPPPSNEKNQPKATPKDPSVRTSPDTFANRIKEHARFNVLEEKVLHKRDFWPKIAAVLYFSNEALTSGEIASVLEHLDVKADVRNVSTRLRTSIKDLIVVGPENRRLYKLTARAKKDMDDLLET